ncbi:MAG TPA: response regulator [Chthoniobacterales bacterium]|nr:response regulator [Chthoniobacterales bacterium]
MRSKPRRETIAEHVNILLVEDHSDTRRVLSALLGRSGHEILTASSVSDALQVLGHMRVNVLLSDLGLPDGDGLELVAKAKAIQPKIKTIALTARGSEKDHELGKKAGFDHYLTKPFDFHELRTLLTLVRKSGA